MKFASRMLFPGCRRHPEEAKRRVRRRFGTSRNLDRLQNGAGLSLRTAVGLLGGPAFSVYKALTAIRLANELTASERTLSDFLASDGRSYSLK